MMVRKKEDNKNKIILLAVMFLLAILIFNNLKYSGGIVRTIEPQATGSQGIVPNVYHSSSRQGYEIIVQQPTSQPTSIPTSQPTCKCPKSGNTPPGGMIWLTGSKKIIVHWKDFCNPVPSYLTCKERLCGYFTWVGGEGGAWEGVKTYPCKT